MHGIVIRNTGNSYVVRTDDGQEVECKVKGNFRLRGIRSTSPVAVGDGVTVMKSTEKATSKTSGKKGKGRAFRFGNRTERQRCPLRESIDSDDFKSRY